MKTIYQKYNDGDHLTATEIKKGYKLFYTLWKTATLAGDEFSLAARESIRMRNALQDLADARKVAVPLVNDNW